MTIYIIKWAIALTALYSLYGLFLRKETFHALNRGVLLAILGLSMVLPLCHLPASNVLSEAMQEIEQTVSGETHVLGVLSDGYQQGSSADVQDAVADRPAPSLWFVALVGIYLVGMLYRWVRYAMGYVSLCRLIRGGERIKRDDIPSRVSLVANARTAMPCSWMRWILISPTDLRDNGAMILRHEMEHIRRGHSWDMQLCDVTVNMLWFLPFAYLLRTDLRDVHEYQADRAVMEHEASGESYQHMLIAKASTVSHAPIVNNLNASAVKKRLAMMFRKESSRLARMKVLYILPLLAIVLMSFARPDIIEQTEQVLAQEEARVKELVEDVIAPDEAQQPEASDLMQQEEDEPKSDTQKPKASKFTLTLNASAGMTHKGYNVIFREIIKEGFGDTLQTVYAEFDDKGQAKLTQELTKPAFMQFVPVDESGSKSNDLVYPVIAYPGSEASMKMVGSNFAIEGTGYYQEYSDAKEYFFNVSQYNTEEKRRELVRQYILEHADEQGALFAFYEQQLTMIEEILDILPEDKLQTPVGQFVKYYAEWNRESKQRRRSTTLSSDTVEIRL